MRGPAEPRQLLGCRMQRAIPIVPLATDHALGIAVLSYAGSMSFGVLADRALVPDLETVAAGIARERDALLKAATRTQRRRRGMATAAGRTAARRR